MLKFSNHPFKGWAYVTDIKKLENDYEAMFVTSMTTPNRTAICSPRTISWHVNNNTVIHVPVARTN